jgi:hypothetical protein
VYDGVQFRVCMFPKNVSKIAGHLGQKIMHEIVYELKLCFAALIYLFSFSSLAIFFPGRAGLDVTNEAIGAL